MITIITKKQLLIGLSMVALFFSFIMFGGRIINTSLDKVDKSNQSLKTNNNANVMRWGLKRNGKGNLPSVNPGADEILNKYNAKYLGDTNQKKIYLTFDEGYENGMTEKILNVLKENKVKGVFFITMPYLNNEGALIKRMIDEGHYVGNHTVNHPSLPTVSTDQIKKELDELNTAFKNQYGQTMKFMRPPKGEYSEEVLKIAKDLGYCTLFWSFAYDDWEPSKQRGADYAIKKVTDNVHNGAILLLHAVSKDNADGLDMIIKNLVKEGYSFGDPNELLSEANNEKQ